jgi:hypothetical protein
VAFDAAWVTASITGSSVTVELSDVGDATELDPVSYPGTRAAFFAPSVFVDDGDAAHEDGEAIVAVGTTFALWLEGALPDELASIGLQLGWNAVRQPTSGEEPGVEPLDAIPLPLNLLPTTAITLGGPSDGVEDASLALVPWVVLDGGTVSTFLHDERSAMGADGWSVTVEGAPPADHYVEEGPGQPLFYALELPVAYFDTDATAGISNNDTPAGFACDGGNMAMLMWVDAPVTLEVAWVLASYGFGTGWQVRAWSDEENFPVEDPEALTLDCSF